MRIFESPCENEQDAAELVMKMHVDPLSQCLPLLIHIHTGGSYTSADAGMRGLSIRQALDTFGTDVVIVAVDVSQAGSDGVSQEVVSAKGVQIHIPTHAHQLRSGKILQRNVVIEQLGNANNILCRRRFTRGADLLYCIMSANIGTMPGQDKCTFLKNSWNSLEAVILSGDFTPLSRSVSWRNLAISMRTLSSLRFFSSCQSVA